MNSAYISLFPSDSRSVSESPERKKRRRRKNRSPSADSSTDDSDSDTDSDRYVMRRFFFFALSREMSLPLVFIYIDYTKNVETCSPVDYLLNMGFVS